MPEDMHVRLADHDAAVLRTLVKSGVFSTLTEAVRFGVKQVVQARGFATDIEPGLTDEQKVVLDAPLRPESLTRMAALYTAGILKSDPRLEQFAPLKELLASLNDLRFRLAQAEERVASAAGALSALYEGIESMETIPYPRQEKSADTR